MGFFSRIRDIAKEIVIEKRRKETTERFKKGLKRGADRGAGSTPSSSARVILPDEEEEVVDVYEVEEQEISTRSYIPGPDPSTLRSGDLLSTAAFYGVTDEEYERIEGLINTAYNDPAASEWERRAAGREIQDAMSSIYERAKETEDFNWAEWREEHYPKGAR